VTAEATIRAAISARGSIGFDDYMALALYGPGGYYRTNSALIGTPRSFYTSPAITPVFGALLARQLDDMWRRLGSPAVFHAVECGASRGLLARDIVSYARQHLRDFAEALRFVTVDVSRAVAASRDVASPVLAAGVPFRHLTGCILAHELWDAFPVVRVIRTGTGWDEIRVGLGSGPSPNPSREREENRMGGGLVEVRKPLEPDTFAFYLAEAEMRTDIRAEIELRPSLDAWIGEAFAALDRGYLLSIDYGYLDPFAWRLEHPRGSVMAYRGQEVSEDPLREPGQWDLTAHVDFNQAALAARTAGFTAGRITEQRTLLRNLGAEPMLRGLSKLGLDQEALQANSMALRELVRPEGFGDFLVAIFGKEAPLELAGFDPRDHSDDPADGTVPVIEPGRLNLVQGRYPHAQLSVTNVWEDAAWETCDNPEQG
jgi:SAM-dependent MidA family methyltransferase